MRAVLLLLIFSVTRVSAALLGTTVLEVRTTGSDSNGGGWVPGTVGGVDYSQSDTPIVSVGDATTAGTTTVVSSAANFPANCVGNLVCISGGTGALAPGWYQIITRSAPSTITVDRTIAGSNNAILKVGGALNHPSRAQILNGTLGMDIWVKAGTYNISSAGAGVYGGRIQTGGSAANATRWEGYNTTRGDIGTTVTSLTRPKFLADTLTTPSIFESLGNVTVIGIEADAASKAIAPFTCTSQTNYVNCVARNALSNNGFTAGTAQRCLAVSCGTGFQCYSIWACVAVSCTSQGFYPYYNVTDSIDNGSAIGFNLTAEAVTAINCTAYGGNNFGFSLANTGATHCYNCVAVNRATKGFNGSGNRNNLLIRCAVYNNGSTHDTAAADIWQVDNLITLTADPFVNAAAGNFALNTTAGGGAALRGLGYPQTFASGLTSSATNVGAVQNSAAVSGEVSTISIQ